MGWFKKREKTLPNSDTLEYSFVVKDVKSEELFSKRFERPIWINFHKNRLEFIESLDSKFEYVGFIFHRFKNEKQDMVEFKQLTNLK